MTPVQNSLAFGAVLFGFAAAAIVNFIVFHILKPDFGDRIIDKFRVFPTHPFLQCFFYLFSVFFFHVLMVGFLFFELESAGLALDAFAEMYDFDVSIEVVFVSEVHEAVGAFVAFYVGVGYHVPFEVRAPLEGLAAVVLLAYVVAILPVPLAHVPVEMGLLLEGFPAGLAGLGVGGELIGKVGERGLLKLRGLFHDYIIICG